MASVCCWQLVSPADTERQRLLVPRLRDWVIWMQWISRWPVQLLVFYRVSLAVCSSSSWERKRAGPNIWKASIRSPMICAVVWCPKMSASRWAKKLFHPTSWIRWHGIWQWCWSHPVSVWDSVRESMQRSVWICRITWWHFWPRSWCSSFSEKSASVIILMKM